MINILFIFVMLIAGISHGAGPLYRHQEPVKQLEFENVYSDIRAMKLSTSTVINVSSGTVNELIVTTLTVQNINGTFLGYGRNRITNGAMRIDQRSSGGIILSSSTSNTYGPDRWFGNNGVGKMTLTQLSTNTPTFFNSYCEVLIASATLTVGASTVTAFGQTIEGTNMIDFAWGTSSAKSVALSFWVRSSSAGVFSGAFTNSAANRSYPFSYTINTITGWEYKSVIIPGDMTGTWLTTSGIGANLRFDLGSGSTFRGSTGTWSASNFAGGTGTSQIITVIGSSWNVTGVQVEISSVPTSYEMVPDVQELQRCQRYFEKSLGFRYSINGVTGNGYSTPVHFSVVKRTTPIMTVVGGTLINVTAAGSEAPNTNGFTLTLGASATGLNAIGNVDDASWSANAEFP